MKSRPSRHADVVDSVQHQQGTTYTTARAPANGKRIDGAHGVQITARDVPIGEQIDFPAATSGRRAESRVNPSERKTRNRPQHAFMACLRLLHLLV